MPLDLSEMKARWAADLKDSVLPFWLANSLDDLHGGYFTCLDHDGRVYDDTKYSWLQGRAVYMWSRMYLEGLDDDPTMREAALKAAESGAQRLDNSIDPVTGLLFFSTTRDFFNRLHLQRKPYAAVFYVQGCLEFWRTGKDTDDSYLRRAESMFEKLEKWIADPSLCGRPPVPAAVAGSTNLADIMCSASLSLDFLKALKGRWEKSSKSAEHYLEIIRRAMKGCERHFDTRSNNRNVFLESCSATGLSSETPAGRHFNPGHSLEVAWFLLLMCDAVGGSETHSKIALDVISGSLNLGWDDQYGGLFYMMDIEGEPLLDSTVMADGKLWWPHTEALIACTLAYTITGEAKYLAWLQKVSAAK